MISLSSTGCNTDFLPRRREIDDLQLVQVIGIDKSINNPDNFMITIASKKLTEEGSQDSTGNGSGGENKGGQKALIVTAEGKTAFDAARNIQTHSDKTIFWGHTGYYLIGEEAAKENIAKYIDFFTRDHELRIEAKIYIVKGSTAKELMEMSNKSDFYIIDKLDNLGENIKFLSTSEEMKVSDLMRFIDIHHGSARVPSIELVSRADRSVAQLFDIESYGYAIFKSLKLVGHMGRDVSRGVNLITNNVGSSVVVVKDLSGQDASLEIIQSNAEVIPHFKDDKLSEVTIQVKVKSNLGEVQSQMDVINEKSIHFMEDQQSEILEKEMKDVIKKVVDLESDCLEICDRIRIRRPLKWHKIEKQWMQILPNLKFNVQVESVIERTYDLREPSGYKGKE
jgi:spore germination protein KC